MDSDDSNNEVTGTFLYLPRRILITEAETTALSNSLHCANFSNELRPLKKRKKTLRKWNTGFETSQDLVEPFKTYGPNIVVFLDSEICTPLDSFLKLFSSDLLEEIVRQTIIYAQQSRKFSFSLTNKSYSALLEF